ALKINNHRQLGAVFGRISQLGGKLGILVCIPAARTRAFDRPRDEQVASRLVEALRACRNDRHVVPLKKRRERSRALGFESQVEGGGGEGGWGMGVAGGGEVQCAELGW